MASPLPPTLEVRLFITGGAVGTKSKCHKTVIDATTLAEFSGYKGGTMGALNSFMMASSGTADAYVSVDELMSAILDHFGTTNLRKALHRRGITNSYGLKYCMWTVTNADDIPACISHESGEPDGSSTGNKAFLYEASSCIKRPKDKCVDECKWIERESGGDSGSHCMKRRAVFTDDDVLDYKGCMEREHSIALWNDRGEFKSFEFGRESIADAGIAFKPDGVTHVVVRMKFTKDNCQYNEVRESYKTALRKYYPEGTMTKEQEQLWGQMIQMGVTTDCDEHTADCFARTFATWLMKLKEPNGGGAKIALGECSITTNNPYLDDLDDSSRAMFELDDLGLPDSTVTSL